ncbi:MAG: flagellar biosynthetic protein FliQ [Acidobacteria bacterium]|nr:flagellar biosynthetic protein FliQ [Acidobacteriota bacterium]
MSVDGAVETIRLAFWVTLVVGGPLLAIGFVGGIVVSVVQVLTSMQDPAFNTVPRLLLFAGATMLLLPWMASRLLQYAETVFGSLDRY